MINLSNTSKFNEPLSLFIVCFLFHSPIPVTQGRLGRWGTQRCSCCASQGLATIGPSPLSHCVQPGGERTEILHILDYPVWPAGLPNLLTSSCTSASHSSEHPPVHHTELSAAN